MTGATAFGGFWTRITPDCMGQWEVWSNARPGCVSTSDRSCVLKAPQEVFTSIQLDTALSKSMDTTSSLPRKNPPVPSAFWCMLANALNRLGDLWALNLSAI